MQIKSLSQSTDPPLDIFITRNGVIRHAVLDPDNLSGKVGTEYQSVHGLVTTVSTQVELDRYLASAKKGPMIILVVMGPRTAIEDGMGLGKPHRHLNPVEITYINKTGRRVRVARLVNF